MRRPSSLAALWCAGFTLCGMSASSVAATPGFKVDPPTAPVVEQALAEAGDEAGGGGQLPQDSNCRRGTCRNLW